MTDKNRRKHCFTLMELLITIGVIAILIGMLLPALIAAREKVFATDCLSNLRNIQMALNNYANDHQDYYPACLNPPPAIADPETNWIYTLYNEKYLTRGSIFICRSHDRELDETDAEFLADPLSVKIYKNGCYGFNFTYLGTSLFSRADLPAIPRWTTGMTRKRIRKPAETISLADVADPENPRRGSSILYPYDAIDGDGGGWPHPRHSGGCNIAWVDGHAGCVRSIGTKNPYLSDPFRNGERGKIGYPWNYWDCE